LAWMSRKWKQLINGGKLDHQDEDAVGDKENMELKKSSILRHVSHVKKSLLLIDPNGVKFKEDSSSSAILPPGVQPAKLPDPTSKVLIDISYGGSVVELLATIREDGSTDITLFKQCSLLSEDDLLGFEPLPGLPTLSDSLDWIIDCIKEHQRALVARNEEIRPALNIIQSFKDMQIITDYEVSTEEERVIFLLKSTVPWPFSSMELLVENNRIVNTNDNCFVMKLVYDRISGNPKPKEFCLQFSVEVAKMLPPPDTLGISQIDAKGENLEEYLMEIKDAVDDYLNKVKKEWEQRCEFLLRLKKMFPANSSGIDIESMTNLKLLFMMETFAAVLDISLNKSFPKVPPSYTINVKRIGNGQKMFTKKLKNFVEFQSEWKPQKMASELGARLEQVFQSDETVQEIFSSS